ncbi:unnamed protein product [Urochloa humidicola]
MKRPRICTAAGSGWSSLPGDLLEQISGHLCTEADHLHVHQVCAHWRASTSLPAAFRPWILARRRLPVGRSPPPLDHYYSVWLPRRHLQREVDLGAPLAGLPSCLGSSRGWLALADGIHSPTRLVLWDPASGAEVRLPPLAGVIQIFLSADPLASPDWMAVARQRGSARATRVRRSLASGGLGTPPGVSCATDPPPRSTAPLSTTGGYTTWIGGMP